MQNFGQIMPRECEAAFSSIAVIARSEATRQSIAQIEERMDCFAALVMTWMGHSVPVPAFAGTTQTQLAASSRSSVKSRIAASASIGSPKAKPCAYSQPS